MWVIVEGTREKPNTKLEKYKYITSETGSAQRKQCYERMVK